MKNTRLSITGSMQRNGLPNMIAMLFIAGLLLNGCKGLENIEITGVDHFEFRGIEDNTILFTTDVAVSNPSAVAFTVRDINLRAMVEGNYLGSLTNDETLRIPARSDSVYNMDFNLKLTNVFTGASMFLSLSKQKEVNVELQGYVRSRSGLVTKKVEVQESMSVEVPELDFFN